MYVTGLYTLDVPGNRTSSKNSVLKYLIMEEEYIKLGKFLLSMGKRVGCKKTNKKSRIHRMDYICSIIQVDATTIHTCVTLEHQVSVKVMA